jgi:hypothetical protein
MLLGMLRGPSGTFRGHWLASWPLVALAVVVGGCGSTETATTSTTASAPTVASAPTTTSASTTASVPTTTTAPAKKRPPTAAQRKSAQEARRHQREAEAAAAKKAREAKARETREVARRISAKVKRELAKFKREGKKIKQAKPLEAAGVPASKRFPKEVQEKFLVSCKAGKATTSSCECLLAKFEEKKGEKEHAIAELLFIKVELQEGFTLPPRVQQPINECHTAGL